MPIKGMTLSIDATAGSVTGGTAATFEEVGVDVKNGIHVADVGETDFLVRTNATFRNRAPVKNPDGTYSKAKRTMQIVVPKQLADLSYAYNLVRIEIEEHPETTAAEGENLRYLGAQLFLDADTQSFIEYGSLA